MKLRHVGLAIAVSAVAIAALAPAAQARSYDDDYYRGGYRDSRDRDYRDYRSYRYFEGRDRPEVRRRQILRDRLFDLADRVRLSVRQGDISRREADYFYRRLDDVRDFLRHDRYLTDAEFDRRSDDLDRISRELRHERRDDYYRYRR